MSHSHPASFSFLAGSALLTLSGCNSFCPSFLPELQDFLSEPRVDSVYTECEDGELFVLIVASDALEITDLSLQATINGASSVPWTTSLDLRGPPGTSDVPFEDFRAQTAWTARGDIGSCDSSTTSVVLDMALTNVCGEGTTATYTWPDDARPGDVVPAWGPTSGSTAVTITASDIDTTGVDEVRFGGQAGELIATYEHAVVAATPAVDAPGSVDVTLVADSTELYAAESPFQYFQDASGKVSAAGVLIWMDNFITGSGKYSHSYPFLDLALMEPKDKTEVLYPQLPVYSFDGTNPCFSAYAGTSMTDYETAGWPDDSYGLSAGPVLLLQSDGLGDQLLGYEERPSVGTGHVYLYAPGITSDAPRFDIGADNLTLSEAWWGSDLVLTFPSASASFPEGMKVSSFGRWSKPPVKDGKVQSLFLWPPAYVGLPMATVMAGGEEAYFALAWPESSEYLTADIYFRLYVDGYSGVVEATRCGLALGSETYEVSWEELVAMAGSEAISQVQMNVFLVADPRSGFFPHDHSTFVLQRMWTQVGTLNFL